MVEQIKRSELEDKTKLKARLIELERLYLETERSLKSNRAIYVLGLIIGFASIPYAAFMLVDGFMNDASFINERAGFIILVIGIIAVVFAKKAHGKQDRMLTKIYELNEEISAIEANQEQEM